MSAFIAGAKSRPAWPRLFLPLRFALREFRSGIGGLAVFLACIALGVTAMAAVGSFARSLSEGLEREGRTILGGDVAFSLVQREAEAEERAFLAGKGVLSASATLRAMARPADGQRGESAGALVELKTVDERYPLYGALDLDPNAPLPSLLAERDGVFGAAAEPALLSRLGLSLGSRVSIGATQLEIRAVLRGEPDKLASGIALGPRLLVSDQALRASGLLQPGSLVRWTYRVRLPSNAADDGAAEALASAARAQFPHAGWEIRTPANAAPQLERNIERFMQFLTLAALCALLVGGLGVANGTQSFLERKRQAIAIMKGLGASGGRVVAIYLTQIALLAMAGTVVGLAAGAALPFLVAATLGAAIPLPFTPGIFPAQLLLAAGYGLGTALAFAVWPLGRVHDVPVAELFREATQGRTRWARWPYIAVSAAAASAVAALAIGFAYDKRIALLSIAGVAVLFAALRLFATLAVSGVRRLPRNRWAVARIALGNLSRPGALTATVMLSFGVGLALIVTVALIDANLRRQFRDALPARAPAFFFLNVQQAEVEPFAAFSAAQAPGSKLEVAPMLRGRIVAVNGSSAEHVKASPQAAWALQGDRGITYAAEPPPGSRVVAGEWWPMDYAGPPLLSLERRVAEGLGIRLGDRLTVNVLGREITAEVKNFRVVDWQSLGINFVLVFSPNTFRGAPHSVIATLTNPSSTGQDAEAAFLKALAAAFPDVTAVSIREAIERLAGLVGNLILALRSASLLVIGVAVLVLGGALGAAHRRRVYEAVILKVLGATRWQILAAYALEYALLGALAAIAGVAAGSLGAWLIVTQAMQLPFVWTPTTALLAFAAIGLILLLGLLGTLRALGHHAAPVLRQL